MAFDIQFDPELARRYNGTGPRYTSYPTVAEFTENFSALDYRRGLPPRVISLGLSSSLEEDITHEADTFTDWLESTLP